MKQVTSASFRDRFLEETEPVEVRRYNEVVGHYYPYGTLKEVPMDDIARKAIEPEKVKPEGRGKLSKGLGELPGQKVDPAMSDAWTRSQPAPKTDKK